MKTNRVVLVAGLGIVVGALAYISNVQGNRNLHAGIGGTWSADMKTMPTAIKGSEHSDALMQLLHSEQISDVQRNALQSQYLSELIIRKSELYGRIDERAFAEAISEAVADGVLDSSQSEK